MLKEAKEREIVENLTGVGLLIVTPDGYFLTIEETRTKRKTGKIAGMRSLLMETLEAGETQGQAIKRLLIDDEEVSAEQFRVLAPEKKICRVQLTPGVWLHAYLIQVPDRFPVRSGTAPDAKNPGWNHINEVLESSPIEHKFRQGTREVIISYLGHKENGNQEPQVYFHCEDEVPQEVFDAVENGLK